jgi:uncharacterized protein YceK
MKWMLIVLAVLVLAGCAPHVNWTKPGVSGEQFAHDAADCQYEGNKATATDPNMFAQLMANNLAAQCMQARGYSRE